MKVFTSRSQRVGKVGEDAVAKALSRQGYEIIERNYTKRGGEIDIVAQDVQGKLYFIEVKSISCDLLDNPQPWENSGYYRPEENLHANKMARLRQTIENFLMSYKENSKRHPNVSKGHVDEGGGEVIWQFDLFVVYIDSLHKKILLKPLRNIIL